VYEVVPPRFSDPPLEASAVIAIAQEKSPIDIEYVEKGVIIEGVDKCSTWTVKWTMFESQADRDERQQCVPLPATLPATHCTLPNPQAFNGSKEKGC
jgi:hypothetical protein